ncbi:hypothetical protein E4665_11975 [Sporolactobacillus shoreae]|uniref:Uncharacterized protein n=1 Tax=Sporolactobacillus shoreae TaxID=1465501 RepID=A0A4Z0GNC1_9BACL|nr:hypothetical protein [Sporolactobacillus shoreae]TGA97340.1 hypothetical protein E4665_11975 [Sporolactobacillus shoreae]
MKKKWTNQMTFPIITMIFATTTVFFCLSSIGVFFPQPWIEINFAEFFYIMTLFFSLTGMITYVISIVRLWKNYKHPSLKIGLNVCLLTFVLCSLFIIFLIMASYAGV